MSDLAGEEVSGHQIQKKIFLQNLHTAPRICVKIRAMAIRVLGAGRLGFIGFGPPRRLGFGHSRCLGTWRCSRTFPRRSWRHGAGTDDASLKGV